MVVDFAAPEMDPGPIEAAKSLSTFASGIPLASDTRMLWPSTFAGT
jgi:hypothetical protein